MIHCSLVVTYGFLKSDWASIGTKDVFFFSIISKRYTSGRVPLPYPPPKTDFNRCHRSQYDQLTTHICQQPTRAFHDFIFPYILVKLYCDTSYYWPSKLRTSVLFKNRINCLRLINGYANQKKNRKKKRKGKRIEPKPSINYFSYTIWWQRIFCAHLRFVFIFCSNIIIIILRASSEIKIQSLFLVSFLFFVR